MPGFFSTIQLVSDPSPDMLHPPVRSFTFVLGQDTLSPGLCEKLSEQVLAHEGDKSNVLSWEGESIRELRDVIWEAYLNFFRASGLDRKRSWIKCWANVLRTGEQFKLHQHNRKFRPVLSGTVALTSSETETIYMLPVEMQLNEGPQKTDVLKFPNRQGTFIMCPGWVNHMTTPNPGPALRITLGMDIVFEASDDAILFDVGGIDDER